MRDTRQSTDVALARRIDLACDRFEQNWQLGRRQSLESYLVSVDSTERSAYLRALLELELELRRQRGEVLQRNEYLVRFSGDQALVESLFENAEKQNGSNAGRPTVESQVGQTKAGQQKKSDGVRQVVPTEFGRYRIKHQIGAGGMGTVVLAEDTLLGRPVALKIPYLTGTDQKEQLERFDREARTAAMLRHPNICPVYDFGEVDGIRYISMAYIEGLPLHKFAAENPLDEHQIARLIWKLAGALQDAHENGVVHRDLKPANIMMDKKGEPIVMDFGLAMQMQFQADVRLTQTGMQMGSPAYMPPEQVDGDKKRIGPPADIYSLGVVLYELLTGHVPFEGPTALIFAQIIMKEPAPPSTLRSGLSPELESICLKMMAKKIEDRYASMDAVMIALTEFFNPSSFSIPSEGSGNLAARSEARPTAEAAPSELVPTDPLAARPAAPQSDKSGPRVPGSSYDFRAISPETSRKADALLKGETPVADRDSSDQRSRYRIANDEVTPPSTSTAAKPKRPPIGKPLLQTLTEQSVSSDAELRMLMLDISNALRDGQTGDLTTKVDRVLELQPDNPAMLRLREKLQARRSVKPARTLSPSLIQRAWSSMIRAWKSLDATMTPLTVRRCLQELNKAATVVKLHHFLGVLWMAFGLWFSMWVIKTVFQYSDYHGLFLLIPGSIGTAAGFLLFRGVQWVRILISCLAVVPFFLLLFVMIEDWNRISDPFSRLTLIEYLVVLFLLLNDGLLVGPIRQLVGKWSWLHTPRHHQSRWYFSPITQLVRRLPTERVPAGLLRVTPLLDLLTVALIVIALIVFGQVLFQRRSTTDLKPRPTIQNSASVRSHEPLILKGHTGSVYSVAFSADGRQIASASSDQTVKLWSALSGQEILVLKGHTREVTGVAFSPDGKRLASASGDGTVRVWDAATGQETLTLKGHSGWVWSVAFSADGKRLVSAGSVEVKVWDATSGQETLTLKGHSGWVWSVAFSPNGKRVASTSDDRTVKVWDSTSGQETLTLKGHTGWVTSVAFSADEKRLASASDDQTVRLWEAATGQETLTLKGHIGPVTTVAFSPDGKRVASASHDQTLKVWDTTSGQETLTLRGHIGPVASVAFSPDGKRLVSASHDQTVKVWDLASGTVAEASPMPPTATPPDSQPQPQLSRDTEPAPNLPSTTTKEPLTLKGHTGYVTSVVFSPDGKRLASASWDETVKVWDVMSGQATTLKGHTSFVLSAAFSSDGRWLASASDDLTVKVWDATSGQETLTLKGHTGRVRCVAFSEGGERLASASDDQTVKVWDATTGEEVRTLKGHTAEVMSVAFSPDGRRLASASCDQTLKVWNVLSGFETHTLKGHKNWVTGLAFSVDGQRLASSSDDQTVKVWDVQSGQEMLTLKGHTGRVRSVAFSPDGKRLASAGGHPFDRTKLGEVKLWDAASGQETLTLRGHTGPVYSVAFSADGDRLASASHDQTVKVWDVTPGNVADASPIPPTAKPPTLQPQAPSNRDTEAAPNLRSTMAKVPLTLDRYIGPAMKATLSTDGNRLASVRQGRIVKLWDVTSGLQTLTLNLKGSSEVNSLAFSADGQRLASAVGATVKVWNVATGQETLTLNGHSGTIYSVAFSPDGKRLASASEDRTVRVWDATSGEKTLTLKGHSGVVIGVEFIADGKRLASASYDSSGNGSGEVKVWDTISGQEKLSLKEQVGWVKSMAFSPDGKRLALPSGRNEVKVWDVTSGHEMLALKGHTSWVTSVVFSADGKRLASAGWDKTVRVWDATSGQELVTLKGHTDQVMSVAFSADGKQLTSVSTDQTVKVWDLSSLDEPRQIPEPVKEIEKRLQQQIELFDQPRPVPVVKLFETLKELIGVPIVWKLDPDEAQLLLTPVAVTMRQATLGEVLEKVLASAGLQYQVVAGSIEVRRRDLPSVPPVVPVVDSVKETLTLKGHIGDVSSVAFSPDGKRLASASYDQTVKVWDAISGQEALTLKGHTGYVMSVAFSADGKRLASASDDRNDRENTSGEVKLWDAMSGRVTLTMKGHIRGVRSVAFNDDGKRLASAGEDGTVKVWDTTSGQETLTLKEGHMGTVNSVAFSADGKRLASASYDGPVKVWGSSGVLGAGDIVAHPARMNLVW